MNPPTLIADIGGTNARFAIVDEPGAPRRSEVTLACEEFSGLTALVESYLSQCRIPRPHAACFAVAAPVLEDHVDMPNRGWRFSVEDVRTELGLDRLLVVNDFTALALAVPHLKPTDVVPIGGGEPLPNLPVAVIGPGTGLGVCGLIPAGGDWIPLASEGGHVTAPAIDTRHAEVANVVAQRYGHASAERLVSGPGLVNIYEALCALDRAEPEKLAAAAVVARAREHGCERAAEALRMFTEILANVAGNLVLTLGARGGVYIGGGIVEKLGTEFSHAAFRHAFERKGRYSGYLARVPSYLIKAREPTLIGLSAIAARGSSTRAELNRLPGRLSQAR